MSKKELHLTIYLPTLRVPLKESYQSESTNDFKKS
jgi:hypothetical protein